MDLGTYEKCSNCSNCENCCCTFDITDNPIAIPLEIEQIKKTYLFSNFYEKVNNIYVLNVEDNKCCFYINNRCGIYPLRPLDCRLFPFDIKRIDNTFYLIAYDSPCVGFKLDDNFINEHLWQAAIIADQLMPYVNDYTCEELNKKFSGRSYQIIKKI